MIPKSVGKGLPIVPAPSTSFFGVLRILLELLYPSYSPVFPKGRVLSTMAQTLKRGALCSLNAPDSTDSLSPFLPPFGFVGKREEQVKALN